MCTTCHHASASLDDSLGNPSATCFQAKQAARSRYVFRAVLPPSVLGHNRQTEAHLVLSHKPKIRRGDFESQITKSELLILRSNHSQTIDLGFETRPRNPRFSSPRARCRSHTAPPDLSIAQPSSTRPVRPSPVLCTRSPTPATILVATRHAALITCTS
jgi:hypothetical protein